MKNTEENRYFLSPHFLPQTNRLHNKRKRERKEEEGERERERESGSLFDWKKPRMDMMADMDDGLSLEGKTLANFPFLSPSR